MQSSDTGDTKEKKKLRDEIRDMIDKEEYQLKKRLPPRLPKRRTDVYVSRKTNFGAQLERSQKLMDQNNEVFIHGLGTAINRAINLALQLKEQGIGTIDIATHTSTVELVDDLEPENDELEPDTRSRNNSAVHIHVYRKSVDAVNEMTLNVDVDT